MTRSSDSENIDHLFKLSSGGLVQVIEQRIFGNRAGDVVLRSQLFIGVAVLWLPLLLLTLIEGTFSGDDVALTFVEDIVPQVRFLIALPLLLVADMVIDPAVGVAIRNLERSGIVPDDQQARYRAAITGLEKGRDSPLADAVMLALAFGATALLRPGYGDSAFQVDDTAWLFSASGGTGTLSSAGWWYVIVSAPLFQFVLFRWIWRFVIWNVFLYRVSRIPLAYQPTHPDFAGGLGVLGLTQQTFAIVFVAFAALMSSTMAHNILFEGGSLGASKLEIAGFIAACIVLIYAPLGAFSNGMYTARRSALSQYEQLGYRLSAAFSAKWITGAGTDVGEQLKNSTDSSTMADYNATFDAVRNMRFLPATSRGVLLATAALAAPFLPLALTEFSLTDLLKRIVDALV